MTDMYAYWFDVSQNATEDEKRISASVLYCNTKKYKSRNEINNQSNLVLPLSETFPFYFYSFS